MFAIRPVTLHSKLSALASIRDSARPVYLCSSPGAGTSVDVCGVADQDSALNNEAFRHALAEGEAFIHAGLLSCATVSPVPFAEQLSHSL